jgi:hypothetical protein
VADENKLLVWFTGWANIEKETASFESISFVAFH